MNTRKGFIFEIKNDVIMNNIISFDNKFYGGGVIIFLLSNFLCLD